MKMISTIGCVVLLASLAHPADITGKWTGKMSLDGSALKRQLQEQSAKLTGAKRKRVEDRIRKIDESVQLVAKNTIKMDLQKGGVVVVDFKQNGKSDPERGKWTQKGTKLFLLGLTGGGDSQFTMNGIVANKGKTLIFDMSNVMRQEMDAKGLKPSVKPKLTLTFKKS